MSSAASRYGEPHPAMSIAITAEITKAISAKIKNITAEGVSNFASLPETTTVRPKIRVRSDPLVVRMWTCQPGQIDACLTPAYQYGERYAGFRRLCVDTVRSHARPAICDIFRILFRCLAAAGT